MRDKRNQFELSQLSQYLVEKFPVLIKERI